MKKPKPFKILTKINYLGEESMPEPRAFYYADEIDAWLEHEKNRLTEVIRGERAEAFRVGHCCGGMRE